MRLLFIAHLFKLGYVRRLLFAHLFKLRDVVGLLLSHLFETANALVGSGELLAEHSVVRLATLCDATLSPHLSLHGLKMVKVDQLLRQAHVNVLDGDGALGLGDGRGGHNLARLLSGTLLDGSRLGALLRRVGLAGAERGLFLDNLFKHLDCRCALCVSNEIKFKID